MRLFAYLDDAPRVGVLDESGLLVRHLPALDGGIDLALAEGRFDAALAEARVVARGNEPEGVELAADLDPLPAIDTLFTLQSPPLTKILNCR